MPDLSALIERIEALTGTDDLVDAEIYATIGGAPHTTRAGGRVIPLILKHDSPKWPRYTASLDAAVALVERVLPGYKWSAGFSRHVPHNAQVWAPSGHGYYEGECDSNRAIALILAALRALHAQEGRDG